MYICFQNLDKISIQVASYSFAFKYHSNHNSSFRAYHDTNTPKIYYPQLRRFLFGLRSVPIHEQKKKIKLQENGTVIQL